MSIKGTNTSNQNTILHTKDALVPDYDEKVYDEKIYDMNLNEERKPVIEMNEKIPENSQKLLDKKNISPESNSSQVKTFRLGENFTLEKGETFIEEQPLSSNSAGAIPESECLKITNKSVLKRMLKPPGGEQRIVELLLKKGKFSKTITMKENQENPDQMEKQKIIASIEWKGYLIILIDADAFSSTATIKVTKIVKKNKTLNLKPTTLPSPGY